MAESANTVQPRTVRLTVKTEVGWIEPQTIRNHHHGEVYDIDRPRSESLESEAITASNFVEVTTVNSDMVAVTIFDPLKVVKKVVDEYLESVRAFADGKAVTDYSLWLCASRIAGYRKTFSKKDNEFRDVPNYEESCRLMYANKELVDSPTLLSWLTGSSEMAALKEGAEGESEEAVPVRADRWYKEKNPMLQNVRPAEVLPSEILPRELLP